MVFIFFNNWAWLNQIDWVFAFIFFLIGQDFCFNKLGVIVFFFFFNWDFFNKDIWVNLYKLHFLSFHFSPQPNERVFHLSTLPSPTKYHERKLKSILSSYFFSPTLFSIFSLFDSPHQTKWEYLKVWSYKNRIGIGKLRLEMPHKKA